MADPNVILMRGRFSNYNDYVRLIRGIAGQFINDDRFVICSYRSIDRKAQDIVVYDTALYTFNSNGTVQGEVVDDGGEPVRLRDAVNTLGNPGLILIVDFFDHDNEAVIDFIDTKIGLRYLTLLYYDKKNRPLITKTTNKNIKLLNRFLRVEELNRIHRRSCIIMKKTGSEGE